MDFLQRLVPDGPFFPYDRQITPRYSAELPKVVRNWCLVSIAVNVATLTIATLILRNLAPAVLFLIFTLIAPLNILFFWRGLIETMNDTVRKLGARLPGAIRLPYPSMQWLAISLLVATSAALVAMTVLFAFLPTR
jgi:hypothetical protein